MSSHCKQQLTFFVNIDSGTYFLLDTMHQTLKAVNKSDVWVLDKYKHLMGFEGAYRTFRIPDYKTMKLFQKTLKTLDLSKADDDIATYLINLHPEFFI